jgi:hypothetical protein
MSKLKKIKESVIKKHDCQFITLGDVNSRGIFGVICGCPICGEIREFYRSGEIRIIHKSWETVV